MTTTSDRSLTAILTDVINVAVLPLTNMSAGIGEEYFSDGVSEDIIDALTGVEGLRLISRGSSFSLKDSKLTMPEIAESLSVDYLVSGTLRKIGSKVRMRVFLNDAKTEEEIWAQSYDQKLVDIFDIEEDIIKNIIKNLIPNYNVSDPEKPVFVPATRNLKAFENYLQGLYFHNKWSVSDLNQAVAFYDKAIKKKPDYYKAYSLKANALTRLSFAGGYAAPVKSYDEAKDAAKKAMELKPNYYRSYTAMAYVYLYQKYDWEQSLMMVNKALTLNPQSSKSMVAKSMYYTIKGDYIESRKHLKRALEIDPLSFIAKRAQADNYFLEGKYESAIVLYNELLEVDSAHEKVLEYKGWSVVMLGREDEAIEMFRTLDSKTILAGKIYSQLAYAYAMKGDFENATRYLKEIEMNAATNKAFTYALDFAVIYTALKDFDKAMDNLEEAVENRRSAIIYLKVNPIWDPMRDFPRFKSLLKRLRLD